MKYIIGNYNNLDFEKELIKIVKCDEIALMYEPTNKACLFLLGIMFAYGKKITIINHYELDPKASTDSISLMTYIWAKITSNYICRTNYNGEDTPYFNEILEMKDNGITVDAIRNRPQANNIFLIYPQTNITVEQEKTLKEYMEKKKYSGSFILRPLSCADKKDVNECFAKYFENANAIALSNEVDIHYDRRNLEDFFYLGIAYALDKKLVILNKDEIIFNNCVPIDSLLYEWQYESQNCTLIRKIK